MESASCSAGCLTISVVIFTILDAMIDMEMLIIQIQDRILEEIQTQQKLYKQKKALIGFIQSIEERVRYEDYDDFTGYTDPSRAMSNSQEANNIAINFVEFLICIQENYQNYREVLCGLVKNEVTLREMDKVADEIGCPLDLSPDEFCIPSEFHQFVKDYREKYQLELNTVTFLVLIAIHLVLRVPDIGKKIEDLTSYDVIETFLFNDRLTIPYDSIHYLYTSITSITILPENEESA